MAPDHMKRDRLDALFCGIDTDETILVAVSGGSDSMALLLLASAWAQRNGAHLQAVTVDHGLRPEAAHEAAFVAGVCAGLGVPHVTLAWEGTKPSFGIQEMARQSRYVLMDEFARECGASVILTGHTLDDQAETVFMRAQRPSGNGDGRGLSGMAKKTLLAGGSWIIRPLLGTTRAWLREVLAGFSQSWIEDPSNQDESFERVRARRLLAGDEQLRTRALALAAVSARFRTLHSSAAAAFLTRHASIRPGPVFELDLSGTDAAPNPVCGLAVQILIAASGGHANLVSRSRLDVVMALASATVDDEAPRTRHLTLGGAIIEGQQGRLRFMREKRNQQPMLLDPGESAIWDGRLHVSNETANSVFIEPLDRKLLARLEAERGRLFSVRPRRALWSTPVVHVQGEAGEQPFLPLVENRAVPKGLDLRIAVPAVEHFCGDFDLALLEWVGSLDSHVAASLQP